MATHIREILNRKGSDVATISPDDTLRSVLHELAAHDIGALVVSPDGEIRAPGLALGLMTCMEFPMSQVHALALHTYTEESWRRQKGPGELGRRGPAPCPACPLSAPALGPSAAGSRALEL